MSDPLPVTRYPLPVHKFASLDGLRGAAALIVFASHSSLAGRNLIPFFDMAMAGKFGVFLFFVLSSFLLSRSFLIYPEKSFKFSSLKTYFTRRILRVYPLYSLYLLLALITTPVLWKIMHWPKPDGVPLTLGFTEFLQQLFLLRGDGLTWSIAVEFKFYFILPFMAYAFIAVRRKSTKLMLILSVTSAILTTILWPPSEMKLNDLHLAFYLPVFITGFILAFLSNNLNPPSSEVNTIKRYSILLDIGAITGCIAFLLCLPPASKLFFDFELTKSFFHHQILLQGTLCAVLLFAAVHGHGLVRKIFEWRPLRYVGMISFSMYLWHPVCIQGAAHLPISEINSTTIAWLTLLVTVVIASLSYFIVERPFLNGGFKRPTQSVAAR